MKIRLIKPLPQPSLGKVVPAGCVIEAPAALSARLILQGTAHPVSCGEGPSEPEKEPQKAPADPKEGEVKCLQTDTPGTARRPRKKQR